jgi:hypothetical protein
MVRKREEDTYTNGTLLLCLSIGIGTIPNEIKEIQDTWGGQS